MKENMYKKLIIKDFKDKSLLMDDFLSSIDKMERTEIGDTVSIYAGSTLLTELFKKLVELELYEIGALDFCNDFFDKEYDSTYCLSVTDEGMIILEPAYTQDGSPYIISGIVFLYQEDCEQDLIDEALKHAKEVLLFGFNNDETMEPETHNNDKVTKCVCVDKNDNIYGFEATKKTKNHYYECSYYSSNTMTEDEVNDYLDKLGF